MRPDTTGEKSRATSGFPSPAEDVAEASLDLQALVVRRPAATFFLRMRGDAMRGAGVFSGDILVVDRSLRPTARRLIVLAVAGELVVRRYLRAVASHRVIFVAAGDDASVVVPLGEGDDSLQAIVWGVVTYVIHQADTLPDGPDRGKRYANVQDVQ
jgi:DNA polymerase V